MRKTAIAVALLATSCFGGTDTIMCASGIRCPTGLLCAEAYGLCVQPDQIRQCAGVDDGTGCTFGGAEGVCSAEVCLLAFCGDGTLSSGEVCDDGNDVDGDGCSADCQSDESCGNGVVDPGEECDCGDGTVAISAGCNGANSDAAGASCRSSCIAHCGDGEINSSEQCEPTVALRDTCVDLGFDLGAIECGQRCQLDFVGCSHTGWRPSAFLDDSVGTEELVVVSPTLAYAADGGRVLKYDGTAWSLAHEDGRHLPHVWATSEDDVWASTLSCSGISPFIIRSSEVLHFDGSEWTALSMAYSGVAADLWGTGPGDFYAASATAVRRWDGETWSDEVTTAGPYYFREIWGDEGTGEVWVAGDRGTVFRRSNGEWNTLAGPAYTGNFTSIWGLGGDVWLGSNQGRVFHWDGAQWSESRVPGGPVLTSMWSGASGVFASGTSAAFHFDGSNWLAMDADCSGPLSGFGEPWMACGGAILVFQGHGWGRLPDRSFDSFSARSRSDVFAADGNFNGGLFHFDGLTWNDMGLTAGTPDFVAATTDKVYAGGFNGWIAVVDGGVETSLRGPSTVRPRSLWANDTGLVVAGEYWPTDFALPAEYRISWKQGSGPWNATVFVGRTILFTDIHGNGDAVVAFGNENNAGVIARFDGAQWLIERELERRVDSVWVLDGDNAVVVGTAGLMLFYKDGAWTEQAVPTSQNFISVSGTSMSDLVAITEFEEVWRFDGSRWTELRGLDSQRRAVQVLPEAVLFATQAGIDTWVR